MKTAGLFSSGFMGSTRLQGGVFEIGARKGTGSVFGWVGVNLSLLDYTRTPKILR
jgi:hypothetical protein